MTKPTIHPINPVRKHQLKVEVTVDFHKASLDEKLKTFSTLLSGLNVDMSTFYNPAGELTEAGVKLITELLVNGLNINIQGAHQRGIVDSAKHLRAIVQRLEELFVGLSEVRTVSPNTVDIDD